MISRAEIIDGMNEKYVVFKREKFYELLDLIPEDLPRDIDFAAAELTDAVVIRRQDVFAEAVFWTYCNEIQAVLEVLRGLGVDEDTHPGIKRLKEISEYFASQAILAADSGKRVPD